MAKTDDANFRTVLLETQLCAASWEGDVRLLGNVRAKDIVRAITEALARAKDLEADVWTWQGISERNTARLREAEAEIERLRLENTGLSLSLERE
jgi:hypothetical protein